MAVPVTVPRLGWSMDEGTFVEWLKRDGDPVRPGDALFVLEGEKAAEPVEALDPGILRIPAEGPQPGALVRVGQVLAYLVGTGEAAPVMTAEKPSSLTLSEAKPGVLVPHSATIAASATQAISPRARRVARELGIDCNGLHGTGAGGRIRERDVRAAHGAPLAPRADSGRRAERDGHHVPHTQIRKLIAARMVAGVTQAAPVTLTTRADATNLVELRRRFNAANEAPPSYTDLIVKLAATALRQHALLQAQWRDDGLFVPDAVDIAIAVDTEAGLLAPVLRGVDRLTVAEIAVLSRELIALARAGRLSAEQLRDATFTITNLGMFGVDAFTPIIHLPQCAVLGIGRIVHEPAVVDDQIVPRALLTLSLTFDHRVVDGAPAARFLDALRRSIEQPVPVIESSG